jgi:diguanylate cyclase (GGDEF)-like protein
MLKKYEYWDFNSVLVNLLICLSLFCAPAMAAAKTDMAGQGEFEIPVLSSQGQDHGGQRQLQIELLAKDDALKNAEMKNQHLQRVISVMGALLTILAGIFIFLLYRRLRTVCNDKQELQQANTQQEVHAVRDPLTGLYNRRSFIELMKSRPLKLETERREDSADNPDCLILMDVDLFRQINDTWGHAAGDTVLTEIALRLKDAVRDSDMVLRWGAEEFLIYSPKSNPTQITRLVARVLHAIGAKPVRVGDLQMPVSVSAGFVSLPFAGVPERECDWEKTLQIADMALSLAKAQGRNRACGLARLLIHYEQSMPVLERDLAAAISAGMVELIEVSGPAQLNMENSASGKE